MLTFWANLPLPGFQVVRADHNVAKAGNGSIGRSSAASNATPLAAPVTQTSSPVMLFMATTARGRWAQGVRRP